MLMQWFLTFQIEERNYLRGVKNSTASQYLRRKALDALITRREKRDENFFTFMETAHSFLETYCENGDQEKKKKRALRAIFKKRQIFLSKDTEDESSDDSENDCDIFMME